MGVLRDATNQTYSCWRHHWCDGTMEIVTKKFGLQSFCLLEVYRHCLLRNRFFHSANIEDQEIFHSYTKILCLQPSFHAGNGRISNNHGIYPQSLIWANERTYCCLKIHCWCDCIHIGTMSRQLIITKLVV